MKKKQLKFGTLAQIFLKEDVAPDASENDELGAYFFGQERGLEDDTSFERQLFGAFDNHITMNASKKLAGMKNELDDIKASGKYSKYLEPPTNVAYRAMYFNPGNDAKSFLGSERYEQLMNNKPGTPVVFDSFKYNSQQGVSSWAYEDDESVLGVFIGETPGKVSVLLKTNTNNGDFMFNADKIADIVLDSDMEMYLSTEKEVVLFGDCVADQVACLVIPQPSPGGYWIVEKLLAALNGNQQVSEQLALGAGGVAGSPATPHATVGKKLDHAKLWSGDEPLNEECECEQQEETVVEAKDGDKNDPFGAYLFGSQRKHQSHASKEPNTPAEDQFYRALVDKVEGNYGTPLAQIANDLEDIKDQGKYSKYLEPPVDTVYRLMDFYSNNLLADFLGISEDELDSLVPATVPTVFTGLHYDSTQNSGVSSWSISLSGDNIAKFGGYTNTVLMITSVDSGNFMFNSKNLAKIVNGDAKDYLKSEKEVMLFGDCVVDKVIVLRDPDHQLQTPQRIALLKKAAKANK